MVTYWWTANAEPLNLLIHEPTADPCVPGRVSDFDTSFRPRR